MRKIYSQFIGVVIVVSFLLLGAVTINAQSEVTGTVGTGGTGVSTGVEGTVISAPTSSPSAGSYSSNQNVTLTASGSSSIRYTTDGSNPSCSSGTIYSGAISVSSTTTIKAIACYPNDNSSPVASFTYTKTSTSSSGGSSGGGSSRSSSSNNSSNDDEQQEQTTQQTSEEPVTTLNLPIVPNSPVIGGGDVCPTNMIITQTLRQGHRDGQGGITQVSLLQGHINRILAAQYNQAAGNIDGIFGPMTKQGVQRLQTALNEIIKPTPLLVIDGIVGQFTRNAINNSCGTGTNSSTTYVAPSNSVITSTNSVGITATLRMGSSGVQVKMLQQFLNRDPETRVAVTGAGSSGFETEQFGPATDSAVQKFQIKHGLLPVDGIVGPLTRAKLNALYASN